jgi:hypothetical protein
MTDRTSSLIAPGQRSYCILQSADLAAADVPRKTSAAAGPGDCAGRLRNIYGTLAPGQSVVHAGPVSAFRFVIREVVSPVAGFAGPVLAGPVLEAGGQLKVGDWLDIRTPSRQIRIQCEGVPLLNWGRPKWVSIAVAELPSGIDVRGLVAETAVPEPDR